MALGGDVAGQGHRLRLAHPHPHGLPRLEGPVAGQSSAVDLEPGSATASLGQGLMVPGLM